MSSLLYLLYPEDRIPDAAFWGSVREILVGAGFDLHLLVDQDHPDKKKSWKGITSKTWPAPEGSSPGRFVHSFELCDRPGSSQLALLINVFAHCREDGQPRLPWDQDQTHPFAEGKRYWDAQFVSRFEQEETAFGFELMGAAAELLDGIIYSEASDTFWWSSGVEHASLDQAIEARASREEDDDEAIELDWSPAPESPLGAFTCVLRADRLFTPRQIIEALKPRWHDIQGLRCQQMVDSSRWSRFTVWDPVATGATITLERTSGGSTAPFYVRATFDVEDTLYERSLENMTPIHQMASELLARLEAPFGVALIDYEQG